MEINFIPDWLEEKQYHRTQYTAAIYLAAGVAAGNAADTAEVAASGGWLLISGALIVLGLWSAPSAKEIAHEWVGYDPDDEPADRPSDYFDGAIIDAADVPDSYEKAIGVGGVFVDPDDGTMVITGSPIEGHDCDLRGCSTVGHKIGQFDVDAAAFGEAGR